MGTYSRLAAVPHRGTGIEKRMNVCDLCGERLEIDVESGEQRCPVCEANGPEE
jgi:hypothetical protein